MKSDFKIYLISGKAHCGKSTVANILYEYFLKNNKKYVITQYSKYLKLYAQEIENWNYDEKTKPRSFLQNTGILIRKELNMPNFFTNRMLEDIKVYENYCDGVIISDVRFKDEIEIIKKYYHNVICINIESNFEQSTLNNKEKLHISEHDLDDYENFDFIIRNNKDILSLKEEILEKVVKE